MALKRAKRSEAKLRGGFSGPSGSGKTYSALLFAYGLMGSFEKVGVLDSENDSASLYDNIVPDAKETFLTQPIGEPFSPQRYIKAINFFIKEGVECMILDSVSHEWEGVGGCLEIHANLGGTFNDWAKVTPMHKEFLDAIINSPMHMLTTTRRKQEYVVEKNAKGKMAPKKLGLKEVQRDGFEYELTFAFDIDITNFALPSKDRTGLFQKDMPFKISVATGELVKEWNNGTLKE